MKKAIIIGSGLAGLISAKILVTKGYNVSIIESSKNLGGLISSNKIKNYYFDHGAHMIQETEVKEINKFLFTNFNTECYRYNFLPQEHYFNGKWYIKSSFLNLKHLNKFDHNIIYKQILSKKKEIAFRFINERDRCLSIYGKKFTSDILSPLLKKYTNTELKDLPPFTKEKFNLSRIIIGNARETEMLKKKPYYDKIIAFNSYKQGISGRKNYYPKRRGINNIINFFLTKKIKRKVKIFLNEEVKSLVTEKGKLKLVITNKRILKNDILIWSGNIGVLNNLFKIKETKNFKEKKAMWSFFHYISKKKLRKKVFYSYFYDKKIPFYRITHYDNFQTKTDKQNKYRFTLEVVSGDKLNNSIQDDINKSLINLRIINKKEDIKLLKNYTIPISLNKKKYIINNKIKKIDNLILTGQAANYYSKSDIIKDVYNKLVNVLN